MINKTNIEEQRAAFIGFVVGALTCMIVFAIGIFLLQLKK